MTPGRERRWLSRTLWVLAVVVLLLAVLRAFVAGAYHVGSPSMEPTIRGSAEGGEWVLVRFDRAPELARFDLVVLERPDGSAPVVKRVVGLPGERVQISGGDLLVDGRRLPATAPRPAPVVLFDAAYDDQAEEFLFKAAPEGPWSPVSGSSVEGGWRLDARDVPVGSDAGLQLYRRDLLDGFQVGNEGERGVHQVNDGLVECELRVEEGPGVLRLRLVEAGDVFEVELEVGPPAGDSARDGGEPRARLTRRSPGSLPELLAEAPVDLADGSWHRLRFANVDNHLRFDLDGSRALLAADYASNQPWPRPPPAVPPEALTPERSVRYRVGLGGEGLVATFRGVRVLRDLYWTRQGQHGVDRAVILGPDEIFVLGDNSAQSLDGRHWGPVRLADVLGRPVAVIWPPRRARWLEGADDRH